MKLCILFGFTIGSLISILAIGTNPAIAIGIWMGGIIALVLVAIGEKWND